MPVATQLWWDAVRVPPPSTLAYQLMTMCRSCSDNHTVEISWIQQKQEKESEGIKRNPDAEQPVWRWGREEKKSKTQNECFRS